MIGDTLCFVDKLEGISRKERNRGKIFVNVTVISLNKPLKCWNLFSLYNPSAHFAYENV